MIRAGDHDEERIMASKQSDHLAEVLGAAQLPWALRNGQTGQREPKENQVTQTIEEKNKAFVLDAFDTLFTCSRTSKSAPNPTMAKIDRIVRDDQCLEAARPQR
jgi:hypothetical protein